MYASPESAYKGLLAVAPRSSESPKCGCYSAVRVRFRIGQFGLARKMLGAFTLLQPKPFR
jgi:hypothetical protein